MVEPVSATAALAKIVKEADGAQSADAPADVIAEVTGLDESTAEYLSKASGGELRSLFAADLRLVRLRRALRVAQKAQKLLENKGGTASEADLNVVVPLLEAASLQSDGEMVERWATLLANATETAGNPVEPGFPDVLRQMSAVNAQLFDYIVTRGHQVVGDGSWHLRTLDRNDIRLTGPVTGADPFAVALENLLRLRLVVEASMLKEQTRSGNTTVTFDESRIRLSAYGAKFARAVQRDAGSD